MKEVYGFIQDWFETWVMVVSGLLSVGSIDSGWVQGEIEKY